MDCQFRMHLGRPLSWKNAWTPFCIGIDDIAKHLLGLHQALLVNMVLQTLEVLPPK